MNRGFRAPFYRSVYITCTELYNWAYIKSATTQEGEPYHDAIDLWNNAIKEVEQLFDGSMTYQDPISGETVNLPALVLKGEVKDYFLNDFNTRVIAWPLYDPAFEGLSEDYRYYQLLKMWVSRIVRFVHSYRWTVYKSLGSLAIKYNPIADYWTKGTDISAAAPYITLQNGEDEEPTITDWNSDDSHTDGYKTSMQTQSGNMPTTRSYTSTNDDDSNGRLAAYQTQEGGTESISAMPNTGVVKKYKEEGNKGAYSPQEMIKKELELAEAFNGILDRFFRELNKRIFLSKF